MGIKNMFKRKEPSEAELVNDLNNLGISTRSNKTRPDKFGAFQQYAQEKSQNKPGFAPVNPYANVDSVQGNPYAQDAGGQAAGNAGGSNPYGVGNSNGAANGANASPYSSGGANKSPYSAGANGSPYSSGASASPYASGANGSPYSTGANSSPYSSATGSGIAKPTAATQGSYPSARAHDPYSRQTRRAGLESTSSIAAPSYKTVASARDDDAESVIDLNRIPTAQPFGANKPARRANYGADDEQETLDLNDLPEEEDLNLNLDYDEELPQEQEVNSEDEEVEAIKQDIRFVKQESVASTRNTLRMAQEADASGTNTMGMLGSQSERIFNAEQNLLLADTQTEIADSKLRELKRLNRSIFVPSTGNPFNKKSRLRQQEESIKNAKAQEKYMRETNRQEMYASEQRIKNGITSTATSNETHQKYRGENNLAAAQRYQFENDSEDDEMEKEIGSNLDQIGQFAKKLKQSAKTIGTEVDSQNARLRKIEEDADRLDINVHMNNTRLQNIR